MINVDVLAKGVRQVESTLYVYVHAEHDEPKSNVCEYISSVYTRLWDEMLQAECLNLNCIVLGTIADAGFASPAELRLLPELGVVYTSSKQAPEQIRKARADKGVSASVLVEEIQQPAAGVGGSAPLFFFDAVDGDIPKFQRVAVGGTFDQLHNGHKLLLTLAAGSCHESLVIGITGDEMLKKKSNAGLIGSYAARAGGVEAFLRAVKPSLKLEPVEIQDPFGPTITDASIQAIVVSSETIPGAHKINQLRGEKGMTPLAILVTLRGMGATLSSTFIRKMQIQAKE